MSQSLLWNLCAYKKCDFSTWSREELKITGSVFSSSSSLFSAGLLLHSDLLDFFFLRITLHYEFLIKHQEAHTNSIHSLINEC